LQTTVCGGASSAHLPTSQLDRSPEGAVSRNGLSIVVPAFNEAARINETLDSIQQHLDGLAFTYEVIVIADGNDRTREIVGERAARDSRVTVGGSEARRGKGKGIREGVARARGSIVGFVDADNKTPIAEIDKILPWFDRGFDVVIGSRGMGESRIQVAQPLYRRLGSRGFATVMHALVGLDGVRDTQCGFKFFRRSVAKHLFAEQQIDGYMFDVEILALADRAGYRIKEVGVVWQNDGDSRLNLIAGNWQNIQDLLRIRRRLRSAEGVASVERRQEFDES
jgi:dolichyl-phosphate beta-glucosyltransferase